MEAGSMIEDVMFVFGQGADSGARLWDGVAGVAMVFLGVWFGFERWGRRAADVARTVATRKLRQLDEGANPSASAREQILPGLTASVAGWEPLSSGRGRLMEDTAPVSLRVIPGAAASGWEGSGPLDLRPRDLGALSPSRRRDVADAARREAVSREEAAREAEMKREAVAAEVTRWEEALQEAMAKLEIGTVPVSPSEIRRLEWGREEARGRWEAADREARQARDAIQVARMFAEIAEAEAVGS